MTLRSISILFLTVSICATAQTAPDFKSSYERQVRNVGYDGVGVETIIDKWEAASPDDPDMLVARFNYYYAKSASQVVVQKSGSRYLGQKPTLSLKDSLGQDVNYFEDRNFDEAVFAEGMKAIDKAIALYPDELRYHYIKISALADYEKESPDLTSAELNALIDRHSSLHPSWTLDGKAVDEDVFVQGVGEYCYIFFTIGSDAGYEYFRSISEKMGKLYPDNTVFIDNIGSYWQVARKNDKQAMKYYKKALKKNPDDYAATKNIKIIQSSQSKKGRSSK